MTKDDTSKPKASSSFAQKELDQAEKQFEKFDEEVKSMTLDRMNTAPKLEKEQQTKMSENEIRNSKDIYLKPERILHSREKFNEDFREEYNFQKEYVHFIAENKEIIGEAIEIWTKKFAGIPCEFWRVPVNKPVWGPRYLAERIKGCTYHRMRTEDATIIERGTLGTVTGSLVVDNTVQRLDAHPVAQRKSLFMGSGL